jgi:arylsulfatase A-like enzyme
MPRPNVVLIVLDDLGFGGLSSFGSAVETPRFDELAFGGLRYNNFHVTGVCAPTRASLLTGRNPHAVGMGFLPEAALPYPGYAGRIPDEVATLPQTLKAAGYGTYAVGKWHLAPKGETTSAGPFSHWPLGMGFDSYFGFLGGATSQWAPTLTIDSSPASPSAVYPPGRHLTEELVSRAITFITEHQAKTPAAPFFLYVATGATHAPHQAPREWIDHYSGAFDDGWDRLRFGNHQRQLSLGVIPRDTELSPRPQWVRPWSEHTRSERVVLARQMELYAAFTSHTDQQVGLLIDHLRDESILRKTIIMVCSDNGAAGQGGQLGYFDQHTRDVAGMLERLDDFGGPSSGNFYASGWAWAENTPFKLWKRYTWLGGVRVPLIVHWPEGIKASESGRVRDQFSHAIDIMPTILHLANAHSAPTPTGSVELEMDGASIGDTLFDACAPNPRSTQYFEMMGSRAIFHDGWKATTDHIVTDESDVTGSRDFSTDRWALYNLRSDFAEVHDVAEQHPELLQRLIDRWWREAEANQVLPMSDTTGPERVQAVRE